MRRLLDRTRLFFIKAWLWMKKKAKQFLAFLGIMVVATSSYMMYEADQQKIDSPTLEAQFETYISHWVNGNQVFLKTGSNGVTYMLAPWYGTSTSTAITDLRTNCYHVTDVNRGYDNFCWVTDEMSQSFLGVSMSQNETIIRNYARPMLNTIDAIKVGETSFHSHATKDYGYNTRWMGGWNGTHVTLEVSDSAIDADYRFLMSLWNLYHNPHLPNDTDPNIRTDIYNMAAAYCDDIITYSLFYGDDSGNPRLSKIGSGRYIYYYQAAGVDNREGGWSLITSNRGVYPGYMMDGASVMAICHQNLNQTKYADASGDLAEQYLNVLNWTPTSGFRGHGGLEGVWQDTGANNIMNYQGFRGGWNYEGYSYCDDGRMWDGSACVVSPYGPPDCMENADAVRFAAMGILLYIQNTTGYIYNSNVQDFWDDFTTQSGYNLAGPSFVASYCRNGERITTITRAEGGYIYSGTENSYQWIGLGAQVALGDTDNNFLTMMNGAITNLNYVTTKGIYYPGFTINTLGIGVGYMDTTILGNGTIPPPDPPTPPPVSQTSEAVCRYAVSASGCFYDNGTEISVADAAWPVGSIFRCNLVSCT